MIIKSFVNNPFQENCYVVHEGHSAILIDCGAYTQSECNAIRKYLEDNNLQPVAHLLTHAHLDHAFGAQFLYCEYQLLPMMHSADVSLFLQLKEQSELFGIPLPSAPLEQYLQLPKEGKYTSGAFEITAIHTPGHTPGGVCYLIQAGDEKPVLFSGDTLFAGSIGRTDLPGGDYATIVQSLRELEQNLSARPDTIRIYPGHGPATTIQREKQYNPYL